MLAEAAGFDDGERWWEFVVEGRRDGADLFAAILEAMAEVRASVPRRGRPRESCGARPTCGRRSARRRREGHRAIAVVCGAWHAPALAVEAWPAGQGRRGAVEGLPKTKVAATWVPVDLRPALARERLRRGDRVAGLVRPPLDRPGPGRRALADPGRPAAARGAARRLVGLGDRGGPAGRGAGDAPRPAPARPVRPGRGDRAPSSASATRRRCG